MRKVTHLFLMVFTVTALAACSGTKELSKSPGAIQGDWTLTSMGGEEVSSSDAYTLSFNTDGTVAGLAGCNYVVAGEYNAQQEGAISLNSFASTKINCDSSTMDSNYAGAVESVDSFEVRNGNVMVLNSGSSSEMMFSKVMTEEEN